MDRRFIYAGAALLLVLSLGGVGMSLAEKFIRSREGFSATAYPDQQGFMTIGYGHKMLPGESYPNGITQAQADAMLQHDMSRATNAVNRSISVPLNANQHAALVSFAYNVGVNAFLNSTLARLLNEGKYAEAAQQFPLWDHIHKDGTLVVDPGLLARRTAEQTLFNTPTTATA